METEKLPTYTYHYFLDEAGDPSFYGKGKSIIVGTPGVSSNYFLGMVKFNSNLDFIRNEVVKLQQEVEADPYFKKIGSIEKKKGKHGFYFHATDDIPEVRMLFFKFFNSLDLSFEAVVGQKNPTLYLERHNANPHEFYADLLSHLLYNKLLDKNRMVLNIAERRGSTRFENLKSGLQNQTSEPLLNIADYFCWSIQRVFEKAKPGITSTYDRK